MAIIIDENRKIFNLQTKKSSYILGIYNNKWPIHIHYGKKINQVPDFDEFLGTHYQFINAFPQEDAEKTWIERFLLEYSNYGHPDLRTPSFHAEFPDGTSITEWEYIGYEIFKGKKKLSGLPATYVENESEADTLEITLKDKKVGMEIVLSYTAFCDFDAITRSVKIKNCGSDYINLKRIMSTSVDFVGKDYDFYSFKGAWARERQLIKTPVENGYCGVDSKRGASSHVENPFVMLATKDASETNGDVYGFSLVYSGNFIAETYVDIWDVTRVMLGINPFDFNWKLESGEEFQAPEVVMVYSGNGFGDMSRTFHKLFRKRLCRGKYRDLERPVLINNWEATYFDFNEEKLLNVAKKAKECGVELMVLDDGWFGKRNDDTTSLGDWFVNREKLPNGIDGLAKKINDIDMKFGLWVEPEMISPESELYKAHPDWCVHVEGRKRSLGRNQLILDFSRDDVCDYIIDVMSNLFSSAPISYIKWDMNRNMTEPGSAKLPADRQRETAHRYMLGLYKVLETLTTRFPDILFEGCSGGGGRFDAGMLYYYPQIWTSDNSDGIQRLFIQEGTSYAYPPSAMGAHVSAVPNHQNGRITDIKLRGDVAMMGQFGYELDLATLTDEEIKSVKEQIKFNKKYNEVFHKGDMYRLLSPYKSNVVAWEFVSEDKNTVILCLYKILGQPEDPVLKIKLQGLENDALYTLKDKIYGGDFLMNHGINTETHFDTNGDFKSELLIFERK